MYRIEFCFATVYRTMDIIHQLQQGEYRYVWLYVEHCWSCSIEEPA